jgi:uncharacterized membrane protein (UPF0136 family)
MRTVALFEMLFGILTLAGGIIDYTGNGNMISLVVGIVAGLIVLVVALSMQKGSRKALYAELVLAIALIGYFGREYFLVHAGGFFPGGVLSVLAGISLLLLLAVLVQPQERKRIF